MDYQYIGKPTAKTNNTFYYLSLCISYSLLILFFVDSRMDTPSFSSIFGFYEIVYDVFWLILITILGKIVIDKTNLSLKISIQLLAFYIFFSLISLSVGMNEEVLSELTYYLRFLFAIFMTVYWTVKLGATKEFITISYLIPTLYICKLFFDNGAPLEVLSKLSTVFSSTDRYRLNFGFYHVNGLGILCTSSIILSVVFLVYVNGKGNNISYKKIGLLGITFFADIIVLIVLLSTASRNSIMSLVLFFVFFIYYCFTSDKKYSVRMQRFLRTLLVVITVVIVIFGARNQLMTLFIDSNRLNNFLINLPLLERSGRILVGLGLVDPGLFGTSSTIFGASYYIDNFYLYIFIETGIIGSVWMGSILFRIGHRLRQIVHLRKDNISRLILSCFMTQLVAGFGETNIIYHIFPSSMIFIALYLIFISNTNLMSKEQELR